MKRRGTKRASQHRLCKLIKFVFFDSVFVYKCYICICSATIAKLYIKTFLDLIREGKSKKTKKTTKKHIIELTYKALALVLMLF